MNLFRISRQKYSRDLSGEGARLCCGRWNLKGVPVVYTSTQESLAALETVVQSPISNLPVDLHLTVLKVPDDFTIETADQACLPERWYQYPGHPSMNKTGAEWVREGVYPGLKVASAVIQSEFNVLVNPLHQLSDLIRIDEVRPFSFDPGMTF